MLWPPTKTSPSEIPLKFALAREVGHKLAEVAMDSRGKGLPKTAIWAGIILH